MIFKLLIFVSSGIDLRRIGARINQQFAALIPSLNVWIIYNVLWGVSWATSAGLKATCSGVRAKVIKNMRTMSVLAAFPLIGSAVIMIRIYQYVVGSLSVGYGLFNFTEFSSHVYVKLSYGAG